MEIDHDFDAGGISSFNHTLAFVHGDCERFFDQDMLAGFCGGAEDLFTDMVGGGDGNCMYALVGQNFAIVRVNVAFRARFGHGFGAVPYGVAHGNKAS